MQKTPWRISRRLPGLLIALCATAAVSAESTRADFSCTDEAFASTACEQAPASAAATPVSPGAPQVGVRIAATCPTFSWGVAPDAERYELALFDAWWNDSPEYAEQDRQGQLLARTEIDAPASSWTPSGETCLDEGVSYLWFVRPHTADGPGAWSSGRYFEIDYDADVLAETVRRELAAQLSQPQVWHDVIQEAMPSGSGLRLTPRGAEAMRSVTAPPQPINEDAPARNVSDRRPALPEILGAMPRATTFPNPAAFKINSSKGVVFSDPAGSGEIPAEGDGVRFMWYPAKVALRAGSAVATEWDDVNIGLGSIAMGVGTKASGLSSTAMGTVPGRQR